MKLTISKSSLGKNNVNFNRVQSNKHIIKPNFVLLSFGEIEVSSLKSFMTSSPGVLQHPVLGQVVFHRKRLLADLARKSHLRLCLGVSV